MLTSGVINEAGGARDAGVQRWNAAGKPDLTRDGRRGPKRNEPASAVQTRLVRPEGAIRSGPGGRGQAFGEGGSRGCNHPMDCVE